MDLDRTNEAFLLRLADKEAVLNVRGLRTGFGRTTIVDDVSFSVLPGETLCIVGESGCGKSVTALSIMRLLDPRSSRIEADQIGFIGRGNLLTLSEGEMCEVRGNEISMIFQEPMTSLNPVFRIGTQICEALRRHRKFTAAQASDRVVELLRMVGIPAPEKRIRDYPHQLSGGMRQRVMIAMAIACDPKLILADEPTTALDVTIQAQILDLLNDLKDRVGSSIILITHDLGVVAEMAQYVCVMYAGVIVEQGAVEGIFASPSHPYTRGLLASIPGTVDETGRAPAHRLPTIPGTVPKLGQLPKGCRFQDRCERVHDRCRAQEPPLAPGGGQGSESGRLVRCWSPWD